MADFIDFEADASDLSDGENFEMEVDNPTLIDDAEEQQNNDPSFFSFFNQTRDIDEVLAQVSREEAVAAQHMEASNHNKHEHEEAEIDELKLNDRNRNRFLETLTNPVEEQTKENSFYLALLFAINYLKKGETDYFEEEMLKEKIGDKLYGALESKKDMCILNLNRKDFDEMCFDINEILIRDKMFLRVYECKDKFRYLFHDTNKEKRVIRKVSACIKEKFNGFNVAAPSLAKGEKKDLFPVDIIYKPVRSQDEVIECFFSTDIRCAYRGTHEKGDGVEHVMPYECYYCSTFFGRKNMFERHIKYCSGKPGIVYDFNIQNVVSFEDNLKYKGDIPLCAYADFETTAPTDDYQNPENRSMFAVSYCIIFAWHPNLNLKRQVVVRGYNHSLSELGGISYLITEQLTLRNQKTAEQLRDAVMDVHSKKKKSAVAELFNIELKFACDILMKWFNFKIRSNNLEIPNVLRIEYNRNNPISADTKCRICNFPLDVTPKGLKFEGNDMSYLDFLIKKEHAFIRNIFDEVELKKSKNLANLETYHSTMVLFIHLVRVAENEIKNVESYDMIYDEKLEKSLKEECSAYDHDLEGLVNEIKSVEIKNFKALKVPKFTMQIYAFIYQCLMDFPSCKFDELTTVTTKKCFGKLYRVINSKVHLHHSHTTGEIIGNTHDFCNRKLRENQLVVSLIGHNFLGFDIFYMVKGYRSTCLGTKDLNMGGTYLTNVNFANISSQVKIIDTLKYFQTTLENLAATADDNEKSNIKKLTQQFIETHSYFRFILQTLEKQDKDKILDLIAEEKGVMPYEKVVDINSLSKSLDQKFFTHTEFYSSLKQSNVSVPKYENAKYLYETLKMRNLGDMNDLYNAQDVILLCEIIENRFQQMYEKYGYNPRKCNSASTLSGCVQRDLSKVIITLPTKTEHAEIFEKSLIGGYSCVNTRLGFDTEVLLPNFSQAEYAKMNIDQSF